MIRQQFPAVLLWGLVNLALGVAVFMLFGSVYLAMFDSMRSGGGASTVQALSPQFMQMQSLSQLLNLVQLVVLSVVYCAVYRAVLHPEQRQFGYLRLGAPELFLMALIFGGSLAAGVGTVVIALVVVIVIASLVALKVIWAAVAFGVIAVVAVIAALIYVALRFSLVGPMMVDDGKFHLGESWTLTKGRVGSLFAIALVIFLILLAGEIVFGAVLVALGFGALSAIAGGLQNLPTLFQQPSQLLLPRLAPFLVVLAVIWTPLTGCVAAIAGAPWARAYRDLRPVDVSQTFS